LHAGGDVKAARTADSEQVRHLRGLGSGEDGGVTGAEIAGDVWVRPARIEGADYRVESGELRGKIGGGNVGGDGAHVGCGKDFGGVAGERGDVVATRGEFTDDGIAYVTGGANDSKIHGKLQKLFYEGALIVCALKSGENRRFLK